MSDTRDNYGKVEVEGPDTTGTEPKRENYHPLGTQISGAQNAAAFSSVNDPVILESDLTEETKLGEGGFGVVYLYRYTGDDDDIKNNNCKKVTGSDNIDYYYLVIKKILNPSEVTANERTMSRLARQNPHPNVNLYRPIFLKGGDAQNPTYTEGIISSLAAYDYVENPKDSAKKFSFSAIDMEKYNLNEKQKTPKPKKFLAEPISPLTKSLEEEIERRKQRNPEAQATPEFAKPSFAEGLQKEIVRREKAKAEQTRVSAFAKPMVKNRLITAAHSILDTHKGMRHLHKHRIVHRDLAARNVFVKRKDLEGPTSTKNGVPVGWQFQLSDLGLALMLDENNEATISSDVGPILWMDSKSMGQRIATPYADLFAVRMTLLEHACGFSQDPAASWDDMIFERGHWEYDVLDQQGIFHAQLYIEGKVESNIQVALRTLEKGVDGTLDQYVTKIDHNLDASGQFLLDTFRPYLLPDYSREGLIPESEKQNPSDEYFYLMNLDEEERLLYECYDKFFVNLLSSGLATVLSKPTPENLNEFLYMVNQLTERMPSADWQEQYGVEHPNVKSVLSLIAELQKEGEVVSSQDVERVKQTCQDLNLGLQTVIIVNLQAELRSIHETYQKGAEKAAIVLGQYHQGAISLSEIDFAEINPHHKYDVPLQRLKKALEQSTTIVATADNGDLLLKLTAELSEAIDFFEKNEKPKWDEVAQLQTEMIAEKNEGLETIYKAQRIAYLHLRSQKFKNPEYRAADALNLLLEMQKNPRMDELEQAATHPLKFNEEEAYWANILRDEQHPILRSYRHQADQLRTRRAEENAPISAESGPYTQRIPKLIQLESDPAVKLTDALNQLQKDFGSKEQIVALLKLAEFLKNAGKPSAPIDDKLKLLQVQLTAIASAKKEFVDAYGEVTPKKLKLLAKLHGRVLDVDKKHVSGLVEITIPDQVKKVEKSSQDKPYDPLKLPSAETASGLKITAEFYQNELKYLARLESLVNFFVNPDGSIKDSIEVHGRKRQLSDKEQLLIKFFLQPYQEIVASYQSNEGQALLKTHPDDSSLLHAMLAFYPGRDTQTTQTSTEHAVAFSHLLEQFGFGAENKLNPTDQLNIENTIFLPLKHVQATQGRIGKIVTGLSEQDKELEGALQFVQSQLQNEEEKTNKLYLKEIKREQSDEDMVRAKIKAEQQAEIKDYARKLEAHISTVYPNKKEARKVRAIVQRMEAYGLSKSTSIEQTEQVKVIFKDMLQKKNADVDMKFYIMEKFNDPKIKDASSQEGKHSKLESFLLDLNNVKEKVVAQRDRKKGGSATPPKPEPFVRSRSVSLTEPGTTNDRSISFTTTQPVTKKEQRERANKGKPPEWVFQEQSPEELPKNSLFDSLVISPTPSAHLVTKQNAESVQVPQLPQEKPATLEECFDALDKILNDLRSAMKEVDPSLLKKEESAFKKGFMKFFSSKDKTPANDNTGRTPDHKKHFKC